MSGTRSIKYCSLNRAITFMKTEHDSVGIWAVYRVIHTDLKIGVKEFR